MTVYKIIGINSSKQAKRIETRFYEVSGGDKNIKLDLEHSTISLPESISLHTISLISSFEQVSIIELEKLIKAEVLIDYNYPRGAKTAEYKIFIVFLLNLFFSVVEFFFGTIFNSQAILSDAIHDLGDAMSIGLAYIFEKISNNSATREYSYGYRRFSLLGAFITSVFLLAGAILIVINTIPQLLEPSPVNYTGILWVALGAIILNSLSAWLMSKGKSANEKLLNIHLFEDLFGWILVLLMSIILRFTDWYILDPLLSLGIAGWIIYVTLPEFFRISKIFLQAVPEDINLNKLYDEVKIIDSIQAISHFHIWSIDGEQQMMTLIITTDLNSEAMQEEIKQEIRQIVLKYGISHITIEMLYDPDYIIKNSIFYEK